MSTGTPSFNISLQDLSPIDISSGLILFNHNDPSGYHLPAGTYSPQELILCNLIPDTIKIIPEPNLDPSLSIVGPSPTGGVTGGYYSSISMTKQYDTIKLLYYNDYSGGECIYNNWIIQSTSSGFTGDWVQH